ncbi:XdhC family protein [Qipengyuania flava]|nr:XdhC family protein [Qipengyuania flava]
MRNPGTHMAVSEDGSFEGSLSGGCIENAVVAEAKDAIAQGQPRFTRFGAGSPYLDIRLPCGGGLDLHFQPDPPRDQVRTACEALDARKPFSIAIDAGGASLLKGWRDTPFDRETNTGTFGHWPSPRLMIVGHGAGVEALALLARTLHCEVEALTPDERIEASLRGHAICTHRLSKTTDTQLLESDPWTAIVFLFHDHDWEIALMKAALDLSHFYLGAMGGRTAHTARCEALAAAGVAQEAIETIHAPIGLFHSSRDPHTLALSALGQIMLAYQSAAFDPLHG